MPKANLLNTSTATYLELIGNGRLYQVPAYQRDYSWKEEHWEDLWTDITGLVATPNDSHYMGALVVEGISDRSFAVIDGQQRLATLSLLVLATISRLLELSESGKDAENNRQRAQALRARFIGEKDPASLIETSKLTLNDTDDPFYQDYLIQIRRPPNERALPRSNRLLWKCYGYFKNAIEKWEEGTENGEKIAGLVSETVGRQLMFIRIAVDNDLNAYTVFETLNARGLELSATDLLKNYLFSRLRTATDIQALQRRWNQLMATVQQDRFPEFLRYHLQCELPRVRSNRLFKLLRDKVRNGTETFALLEALEARADLFAAIADPLHAFWIDRKDCAPYIRTLNVLRVRQMTPVIFAAWEKFSDSDLVRTLKLLVAVLFRYSVICRLNPNALEPAFHEVAKGLLSKTIHTPAEVFSRLRSIYVDDQRFEQDFSRFSPDSDGQGKQLVRYILAVLESDLSGRLLDPATDPGSIEHILPQNPGASWEACFPMDTWDRYVDRIGNLTWLEPGLNRRVGNSDISDKKSVYDQSRYALTNTLPEQVGEDWTPSKLEARQAAMARRAIHLWRSDFA